MENYDIKVKFPFPFRQNGKKRNVKRKLLQCDHESPVKAVDKVKNGSLSIRAAA